MTGSKKAEDKSEFLVLVGFDIKNALGKSESSLLSIHLEFCVFCCEIFRYFSLWKGISKSIDLLKIYFLIGQYFLILLCISQYFLVLL